MTKNQVPHWHQNQLPVECLEQVLQMWLLQQSLMVAVVYLVNQLRQLSQPVQVGYLEQELELQQNLLLTYLVPVVHLIQYQLQHLH
jgi:hypothetical protein